MATNNRLFRLFLTAFFFLCLSSAFAQNSDTESGEQRLKQRLSWSRSEYALRYEVEIEIVDGGTYRESTTELYIEVYLRPGSYRFRVIPYGVLDKKGSESEWEYIEVHQALQPGRFTALPEYISGGRDEPSGYLFNITGENLDPEAEVFIRFSNGTQIPAEMLDSGGGADIRAFVESGALSGEYDIVVINPGGLESSIKGVPVQLSETEAGPEIGTNASEGELARRPGTAVEPSEPFLISAGLAYIPSFPIYGDYTKGYISTFSFTARINALFYTPIGIYIGPEISGLMLMARYPGNHEELILYEMQSENIENRFTMFIGSNVLIRKWFADKKTALSFRMGLDFGIVPEWIDQVNIRMDISFLWRFAEHFMLEGGLDYSNLISADISGGFFRPWVGVSFQF